MHLMKTTRSLLTGIAILGLGIAPLLSAAAQGSDVYFYPSSGWQISSAQNAGQTICAAQAKFNNGFTISFQGSDKWVESLNIDLKQDALKQGETYPVTLSVPGQTAKNITGHATSARNLMIKMVGNKELYEMIRSSSVFDLKIEDNAFRFYMVGFASKASEFEKCMASNKQEGLTVASNELPENTLSVSSENIGNETLQMEKAEAEAISTPPKPVKHENQEKKITPKPVKSQPQPTPSIDMLPIPGMTENDLTEKDIEAAPVMPVQEQIEKKSIKSEVKVTKTVNNLEADLTHAGDKKKSKRIAQDIPAVNASDSKDTVKLKQMMKDLQEENEALNEEVREMSVESRDENTSIETRNWNLERATMRYHEAERQLKRLGQQLQQERSQCKLEKQELEAMLFDPQVTEAQQSARLADLTRQLEEAQAQLESERRTFEERIRVLQEQL